MKKIVLCLLIAGILTSCAEQNVSKTEDTSNIENISENVPVYDAAEKDLEEDESIADKETPETEINAEESTIDPLPETDTEISVESIEPYSHEAYSYYLSAEEHDELDFSYHDEYMNYAICDFAIAPNGNLLLLIMSDSIVEYTPEGEFVGRYSYNFDESGLNAYMFTCDTYGNFYMADGGKDVIIKADRNEIKNISSVGAKSGLPALTLSESMYARDEDCLEFMNYNDHYDFCIYRVDTKGEEAVLMEEPFLGQSLGGGTYAYVERVFDENGDRTSECKLTVYYSDGTQDNYRFISEHEGSVAIYGLGIYGITEGDTIIGYIREWYRDGDGKKSNSLDTRVIIEKGSGITSIGLNEENNDYLTRCYGGETYVMQRMEDGIRIIPLMRLYEEEEWSEEHWFKNILE